MFICPICSENLQLQNRSLQCQNNHCYDLAKEGYVNLLPIGAKKSKLPGDNKEMMMARREFLASGHFNPLAQKVAELVSEKLANVKSPHILDIGCGEGFYTSYVAKSLNEDAEIAGLDISKVAVRYASKRYKNINFCTASAFQLPFAAKSLDLVLRIYAPSSETELQRVIKVGGFLLTVTPGEKHLYQIRESIYETVTDHSEESQSINSFKHIDKIKLPYIAHIKNKNTFEQLLDMTPFAWKIKPETREKLLAQSEWNIDCDFNIDLYERVEY